MKLINILLNRNRNVKKSFLITLFLMIASFSCLLILLLSSLLYYSFQNVGIVIIKDYNKRLLSQVSYNASYMNTQSNTYAASLFNSGNSMQLIFESIADPYTANRIMTPLDETLNGIPFVHSVYFYSGKFELYYAIGPNKGIYPTQDFYDRKIEEIVQSEKNYSFRPIARKMPKNIYVPNETVDVYSYVFTDNSYISSGKINAAVILNIRASWISDTINTMKSKGYSMEGNILVVDSTGRVMADSTGKLFLQDYSHINYISRIISSGKEAGSFDTTIDGEKNVVTFAATDMPDWYYVALTPYSKLIKPLNRIRLITVAILLFILLATLATSIIVSKRLYNPVKSLRAYVTQLYGTSNILAGTNEFNYISGILKETREKMDNLQSFRQENFNVLKSNFIKGLLKGDITGFKAIEDGLALYKIVPASACKFFIIIIRIDNFNMFCVENNDRDRGLYRFAICNISEELLSLHFSCISVDMENDHIALIVNIEKNYENNKLYTVLLPDIINKIQNSILQYFNLSLSVTVSSISSNINSIQILYKEAYEFSNYRLRYGKRCIITPEMLNDVNKNDLKFPSGKNKLLIDALKLNRIAQAKKLYLEIADHIVIYSYQNIRFVLTYLFSSIYNVLNSIEINSTIGFNINFSDFCSKLNILETLDEINSQFMDLFDHIAETIENNKNNKTELIVRKILDYINSNYMDANLSLTFIGDMFKLSPDYISRIFRETVLKSVSEYINEYRIEKAKEFLIESHLPVDEIIGRLGVENKKYFFTLFKKHVGTTPSEYRFNNIK